jgi:hypothetical protein
MGPTTKPMSAAPSTHVLRSGTEYSTGQRWRTKNPEFERVFSNACRYFKDDKVIPQQLLQELEKFSLTMEEYGEIVANREDKLRHVYWEDGKLRFNTFTKPPHGSAIGIVSELIGRQFPQDRIFVWCNDCNSLRSLY